MAEDVPYIWTLNTPLGIGWRDHVKGHEAALAIMVYSGGGLQYTWLEK